MTQLAGGLHCYLLDPRGMASPISRDLLDKLQEVLCRKGTNRVFIFQTSQNGEVWPNQQTNSKTRVYHVV